MIFAWFLVAPEVSTTPHPKEEAAGTQTKCQCSKNFTWLVCTGFSCDKVPKSSVANKTNSSSTIKLRKLRITQTTLKVVTRNAFHSWPDLTHLRLDNNHITWVEPGAFRGLVNLRTLDVSSNQLRRLPAAAFADGMSNLRIMDLRWNGLERLSDVAAAAGSRHLPKLERLLLSGNHFEQVLVRQECIVSNQ